MTSKTKNAKELTILHDKLISAVQSLANNPCILQTLAKVLPKHRYLRENYLDVVYVDNVFRRKDIRTITDIVCNTAAALHTFSDLLPCTPKSAHDQALEILNHAILSNCFNHRLHSRLKFFNNDSCIQRLVDVRWFIQMDDHVNKKIFLKLGT